jgi:thymidylate synthase (FAD)
VAFTELVASDGLPERLVQWETFVLAAHRGHRLGTLVKTAVLRRVAAELPQARRVVTTNAEVNGPMIAVNDAWASARTGCWWPSSGRPRASLSPPLLPRPCGPLVPPGEAVPPAVAPLKVQVIGWTHFEPPADVPWETDTDGGQALAEFAGRACYQSWSKPNPATGHQRGLPAAHPRGRPPVGARARQRHLLPVGHQPLAHPRADPAPALQLQPALAALRARARRRDGRARRHRRGPRAARDVPGGLRGRLQSYTRLLEGLEKKFADVENVTSRRKQARQAARAVLPNATETRIVVTGNYRAMRHFVAMRASEHADVEIRELAVAMLRELQRVAPNAFADFEISALPDGTEVASSPLVGEG